MKRYEQIEHTADLKIRAYGESLPELFENAAAGMLEAIAVVDTIDEVLKIKIEVEADALEDLLVAWLSEIHFHHEVQEVLFKRAQVVQFDEDKIIGFAYGEAINPDKHEILTEIKSVTYHQLEVEEWDDGMWAAQVIFDL